MKGTLKIYRDGNQVNAMAFESNEAKEQLLRVFYSREFYGTKTRIHKGYNGNIKITQYFNNDKTGGIGAYKYEYVFENVEI